ncbi:zincin [Coniochaeta sp. PMI_546]|nr:zincin [Coniochaeta sp. PMI_546]
MHATSALCLTPACVHVASELLYNLSPDYKNIDPCTDFDKFVCDGWRDRHDLRPDQGSLNSFSQIADSNNMVLRHILEAPYPDASDHSFFSPMRLTITTGNIDQDNFNELQRAYNACMAIDAIKQVGITPLQDLLGKLSRILTIDDAAFGTGAQVQGKDAKDISDAILFLEQLNIPHFVSLGVGSDDKNPDTQVVFAGPRYGVGLPSPTYYSDKDTVSSYQSAMAQVLKGVLPNPAARKAVDKLAAAVVLLESKIAAATPPLEDLQDSTKSYNPLSLKDTAALIPILGLDHVLTSLVPSNYTLDRMITQFPDFFANVSDIIASSGKDTVQAFLSWKIVQATASRVEAPEIKPYTQFMNKLSGKDPDAVTDRWRTCLSHVDNGLGWILSRFYVEKAFSAAAKDLGDQIVSDIKEQFISRLADLDWMDDEVKKLAADKVNAIIQKIGYPTKSPNIMDPAALQEHYAGLTITDAFFNNSLSITSLTVNQSWSQLGKPTDKDSWGMTAPTVNAYYNPPGNEIVFPAGIMQFPGFGAELPKYINYGAFGAVAGHELSHAFDNNGRHYDVHGNMSDWWTNNTVAEFEKRAECFVKEYSNFTAAGTNGTTLHVNGRATLGENIADAGGLSASYSAWVKRRQSYPDLDLPGLSDVFSQEQLFYMSYGNFWCSKYTQSALTRSIYTDEHSPAFARIEGTAMMNSRGFREAFNCPAKEPVCELW